MKRWEVYLEILLEIVFWITGIALLLFGFPHLLGFLWPFVVSWVVALLAGPLCKSIENRLSVSRKWISAFLVFFSIGIVVGIFVFIIRVLGGQAIAWATEFPSIYHHSLKQMEQLFQNISQSRWYVFSVGDGKFDQIMTSIQTNMSQIVNKIGTYGMEHAGGVAKGVTNGLIGTIVMFLSAYFLICDRDQILHTYEKLMPGFVKEKVDIFYKNTLGVLVSYCFIQLKLMGIIFIILSIGFFFLKIKYSILFAFLTAIMDALPFLGTGTILIPWAVYKIITGEVWSGICFLVIYGVCLVLKQVLQPKMMGKQMELNPIVTLLLMYVGLKLKGIIGLIFALIFGIFFVNLYKRGMFDGMICRWKKRLTLLHDLDQRNE